MFVQRDIEITIVLSDGSFSGSGNTKIMRGLATKVNVEKVGLPDKNKASVEIYGVSMADMEQMTTLAFETLETDKNLISIKAGNKDSTLDLVFAGEITTAFANFNRAPDVVFTMDALAGYFPALTAIPATSASGEVTLASLFSQLAGQAGYTLVNEGVTGSCVYPYYIGSPIEQMKQLAADNDVDVHIDDNEIILMPQDGARKGNTVVLSADTGLLGYPTFTSDGIQLSCIYEPMLVLGGLVQVESIVPKATGLWKVTKLSHALMANFTGQNMWESYVEAVAYDN